MEKSYIRLKYIPNAVERAGYKPENIVQSVAELDIAQIYFLLFNEHKEKVLAGKPLYIGDVFDDFDIRLGTKFYDNTRCSYARRDGIVRSLEFGGLVELLNEDDARRML